MGSCVSRQKNANLEYEMPTSLLIEKIIKNLENIKINEEDPQSIKSENYEYLENQNQFKFEDLNLFDENFKIENDDDSIDENLIPRRPVKKKQKLDNNPDKNYENVLEIYHKKSKDESFINSPLTLDEILEVLSNSEISDNYSSPASLGQLHSEESFIKTPPNNDFIIDEAAEFKTENDPDLNFILPSNNYIQNQEAGEILNAVPKKYDEIKNKITEKYRSEHKNKIAKCSTSERLSSLSISLSHTNELKQNIVHLMIINKDEKSLVNLLDCISELDLTKAYLNSADDLLNTPLSYAIMNRDVPTVQLLLRYRPILPAFCISRFDKSWIPVLHCAAKSIANTSYIQNKIQMDLLIVLLDYISSFHNQDDKNDFLETKDQDDLTILHFLIIHFSKSGINESHLKLIVELGANLEINCPHPRIKLFNIDALGQAMLSKYPYEIIKILVNTEVLKFSMFETRYKFNNCWVTCIDLLKMRRDLDYIIKESILELLKTYLLTN